MVVIKNDLCMMLKDYKKVEIDLILNNQVATILKFIKKINHPHQE